MSHLSVFQRTAQWILPTPNDVYTPEQQRAFAENPSLMSDLYAEKQQEVHYLFGHGVLNEKTIVDQVLSMCEGYLNTVTDPVLRAKLQPPYPVMCKRLIFASGNGYYEALQKPNAELVTEGIERFTANGILTSDGVEREFDVIWPPPSYSPHTSSGSWQCATIWVPGRSVRDPTGSGRSWTTCVRGQRRPCGRADARAGTTTSTAVSMSGHDRRRTSWQ